MTQKRVWACSVELEEALWAAARARLGEGQLRERNLATAVERRSRIYTSERDELEIDTTASSTADLAARALFFTVADAPKVKLPLAELDAAGLLTGTTLRVLDLGAGVGAMTWGLVDYVSRREIELDVHAVDHDEGALALMNEVKRQAAPEFIRRLKLRTEQADIRRFVPEGSFDLILVGSALNELREAAARETVEKLLGALDKRGALIIIEPALRETTRDLHGLRDWLLDAKKAFVFAPCTRSSAPCPALSNPNDWCHEDRPTELPPRARALSSRTHLREHGLKFAYLVLRHQAATVGSSANAFRVVSSVRRLKGKHECFVCGDKGRLRLRLLKREESPSNRIVRKLRRGDLIAGVSDERVAPSDQIEKIVAVDEAHDD